MNYDQIQFVIVLYNVDIEESETFQSFVMPLLKFGCSLFIYDNSPIRQTSKILADTKEIVYVHDAHNSGLSKAYNVAAAHARNNNKKYLLLLDQDTLFPESSLNIYIDAFQKYPGIKLFAPILSIQNEKIMSPCKYKYKWGKLIDSISPGVYSLEQYVPVNSGLCIDLNAFFEVGGYNENVKLDGADFQFIERFKTKHKDFVVLNLRLFQNFSLFDNDISGVSARYKLFIEDLSNFETKSILDKFWYQRVILIRTLLLTLKSKNMCFIKIYFNKFLNPFR